MFFVLDGSNLTKEVAIAAKYAEVTVASTGAWSGTVTVSREINGEVADYIDGAFTTNFDFVFHPATDFTTFTFAGTGSVNIEVTISKFAK